MFGFGPSQRSDSPPWSVTSEPETHRVSWRTCLWRLEQMHGGGWGLRGREGGRGPEGVWAGGLGLWPPLSSTWRWGTHTKHMSHYCMDNNSYRLPLCMLQYLSCLIQLNITPLASCSTQDTTHTTTHTCLPACLAETQLKGFTECVGVGVWVCVSQCNAFCKRKIDSV